ncbi:uncharacterized protein [Ptychodera flava]|uniref:uncharacterized protein n=1 Tax=Ptychodera flava TaxID=63121 RepID=UPI003969E0AA
MVRLASASSVSGLVWKILSTKVNSSGLTVKAIVKMTTATGLLVNRTTIPKRIMVDRTAYSYGLDSAIMANGTTSIATLDQRALSVKYQILIVTVNMIAILLNVLYRPFDFTSGLQRRSGIPTQDNG